MYKAPQLFLEKCKNNGISAEDAQKKWEHVWSKSLSQFMDWLLDRNDLTESEISQLTELFKVTMESEPEVGILESVRPILSESQYVEAQEQLGLLYFENLRLCAVELSADTLTQLRKLISSMKQ